MSAPPMVFDERASDDRPAPVADDVAQLVTTLEQVNAAVILGVSHERVAALALQLARALCATRRVVVADLLGDVTVLSDLGGGVHSSGLTDGFENGQSLNEIARPVVADDGLFVLPLGTVPLTRALVTHERWTRLVRGFADADALLLIAAPVAAPGIEALVATTAGAILVDAPERGQASFHVLGEIGQAASTTVHVSGAGRVRLKWAVIIGTLALGAAGLWAWRSQRSGVTARLTTGASRATSGANATAQSNSRALVPPSATAAAGMVARDTVRVLRIANPGDSAVAAAFAVELVAANSVAGANSALQEAVRALDGLERAPDTVVPVTLGGAEVWYKAVVGAWVTRDAADVLLASLRARGIVRKESGRVVRAPFALLLATGLTRAQGEALASGWRSRGVLAYVLRQDDGSARVFAGAFETPAEAAVLAAAVRDAGTPPEMAFRTGRAY